MCELIDISLEFATLAHQYQKRRYTGENYIVHPIEVAQLVKGIGGSTEQICAALLHDVVEDTPYNIVDIKLRTNEKIADIVYWLTDKYTLEYGNRAARKHMNTMHIFNGTAEAQDIKVMDTISNTVSIMQCDPTFYKVYKSEKLEQLDMLTKANQKYVDIARGMLIYNRVDHGLVLSDL